MAGGVAVFDYNRDGRPDIFFTNGANLATLQEGRRRNIATGCSATTATASSPTSPRRPAWPAGRLRRTAWPWATTTTTATPTSFVAGVHHNTLYHNNGDGTFTDVTEKAGLNRADPEYGPLWAITAVWVDVNNDGLLDLFVVNYLKWDYATEPKCEYKGAPDYCRPAVYKGLPNQFYSEQGRRHLRGRLGGVGHPGARGQGHGRRHGGLRPGRPAGPVRHQRRGPTTSCSTTWAAKIRGSGFSEWRGAAGRRQFHFGNGAGFPGFQQRRLSGHRVRGAGTADLSALPNGREGFREVTTASGMRAAVLVRWRASARDSSISTTTAGRTCSSRAATCSRAMPGTVVDQHNTVFRNLGASGKWQALTEEAGLTAAPPGRHRGCAFGDLDGDGRVDVVTTALDRSGRDLDEPQPGRRAHWLDIALEGTKSNRDGIGARIKVVTKSGAQYNHMTTSVGYASSSYGPVHFGLGADRESGLRSRSTGPQASCRRCARRSARRPA
jgi:hypothetical protein